MMPGSDIPAVEPSIALHSFARMKKINRITLA